MPGRRRLIWNQRMPRWATENGNRRTRAAPSTAAFVERGERRGLFDGEVIGWIAPSPPRTGILCPPVLVLETHDVVFAEVAAGLHFHEEKRELPGVLQPVLGADRNVGRL